MTRNQIIATAIRAALETTLNSASPMGDCFPCGFSVSEDKTKRGRTENAMIIILQEMLTRDEYDLLVLLVRRDAPGFQLPKYWQPALALDQCFSIFDSVKKHLDTVINRPISRRSKPDDPWFWDE